MKRLLGLICIAWFCGATQANAQSFTDISASLAGVSEGSVAWGDYDNDGDLDILLTGFVEGSGAICKVYRNDGGGSFSDIFASLAGVIQGSVAWGDYDNDGDLDILLTGLGGIAGIAKVYRNDGGVFMDIATPLAELYHSSAAWGDYDNDGDLDILLIGCTTGGVGVSKVYRNDGGGSFSDIFASLAGVSQGSVAWGDYDNDSDLDILLTGHTGSALVSKIYRNDGGVFLDIAAPLTRVYNSSVAWGDYDNDGDLDILLTGHTGSTMISKIYRNDGGIFSDVSATLTGVQSGSVAWGDYDNDGDLDILLTGEPWAPVISKVYRNDGGVFVDIAAPLTAVGNSSVAWGDYDNDSDLDILLTGRDNSSIVISKIYRNNSGTPNSVPSTPGGLVASLSGNTVTLGWNKTTDAQTSQNGLTYNLRLSTTPGGVDVASPMANVSDGYRRVPRLGATNHDTTWTIKGLEPGTYYWSVQAIDNALAAGSFAAEQSFTVVGPLHHFAISAISSPQTVDVPFSVTLAAQDINNNTVTDFTGTVDLTTTEGTTTPLISGSFVNGQWTGNISVSTEGIARTITATRTTGTETGTSNAFDVVQPLFTDMQANLPPVVISAAVWGDYDNDGDLDIAISGNSSSADVTSIYRNDGGVFTNINAPLITADEGALAWGDFDNDNDLDLLTTGQGVGLQRETHLYRNNAGSFVHVVTGMTNIGSSAIAWGDYDSDGDLDALLAGSDGYRFVTKLYRNSAGSFSEVAAGLRGMCSGSADFVDYDNDGDLDIMISGSAEVAYYDIVTKLYLNTNGTFTEVPTGLPGVSGSTIDWADFDADGDLDLLIAGSPSPTPPPLARVYRNNNGTLTDINAGLTGTTGGFGNAWGDYDNDGDLDILLIGNNGTSGIAKLYNNVNGTFSEVPTQLPGIIGWGSVGWGDYDSDGDLDILLTGNTTLGPTAKVFRNNLNNVNPVPTSPDGLNALAAGHNVTMGWNAASDGQTVASGLSYNLRVGTTPGGSQILSPMAQTATGVRRLPRVGIANGNRNWQLKNLPLGTYYWSVQAIDNSFAGGPFTTEQTFVINDPPVALNDTFSVDSNDTLDVAAPGVLSDDTDPNSDPLTASVVADVSHGILALSPNGSFQYIPEAGYVGNDQFTYTASDGNANDTAAVMLNIYDNRPFASFTANPNSASCNENVSFDATSSYHGRPDRSIVNYAWDFGDGSAATGQVVNHAFGHFGSFTVALTVTDNNVPPRTATTTTTINVNQGNQAPTANAGGPYTVDLGSGITLNGAGSSDPNIGCGDAIIFTWMVGGMIPLSGPSPSLTPAQISGLGIGSHAVQLTVMDGFGLSNTATASLTIYNNQPIARLTANPNPAACSQNITFDARSSSHGRPDRSIVSYAWDFGDGNTATGSLVSHSFDHFGSFTANVTVTDDNAPPRTSTASVVIMINQGNQAPTANAGGPYTADLGNGITLNGTASSDPNAGCGDAIGSYSWLVAGSIALTGSTPSLSAAQISALGTGSHSVTLGVTDGFGLSGTASTTLSIYNNQPIASFTAVPNPAACNQPVTFDASASSHGRPDRSIISYEWDFDNDGIYDDSTGQVLSRVFDHFGVFPVGLRVTDNNVPPQTATASVTVQVSQGNQAPSAHAGGPYIVDLGSGIILNGSGSSDPNAGCGDRIVAYAWDINNDGTYDITSSTPTTVLDAGMISGLGLGAHTIILRVTDTFGTTGTAATTLTVNQSLHHFAFATIPSPQTAGTLFSITITAQDINNNTVAGFTGTIDLSTTAGTITPTVSGAFTGGQFTGNVTVSLDGTGRTITATRTGGTETGTSNAFDVAFPLFSDINAVLPGLMYSSVAWGDYDNDGDLDILLMGSDLSIIFSKLYRNNADNTFTDVNAGLTGGFGAWGDYDNDGDLDILVNSGGTFSKVYRNDGNSTFTDINAGLVRCDPGSAAWGDYDNDGDLDIVLSGYGGPGIFVSRVYRNDGSSTFTDINAGLPGLSDGSVAWGDYDNDGDLDILLTGVGDGAPISSVYRNNGNSTFTDIGAGLTGISWGSVAWGDFDNDGDLDILLTGEDLSVGSISKVYRNNGSGTFTDINAGLAAVQFSSAAWGDYDNDGNLDILLTGIGNGISRISRVYRNQGGEFIDTGANLPDVQKGSVAWGDYDNDGDLDIVLTGEGTSGIISKVYRNNSSIANTAPGPPASLTATPFGGETVALAWTASTDGQTPADGLSYNLRVGTTPGASNILGPMANTTNGYRRVPKVGPQQILRDTITLSPGTYYWGVQSIDNAFAGGPFAVEQSFTINAAPVALGDSFAVDEDDTLIVAAPGVLANDTNTTALTAALVADVSHGSLSLSSDGSFMYIPLPNFSGSDSFVYLANDGGLTDTAITRIVVGPVNDSPSFAKGSDQTAPEDAGAQTVAGWATGVSPGPSDESGQVLTFLVSNDNNALFTVQPDVDEATGTLTFTPAPTAHGVTTVTVALKDDGGIANGGNNESNPQTFTITITNVIGPVDHFVITTISSPQTAGTPFSITITAFDSQGDTAMGFAGTADLTTNAGIIAPAVSETFINGQRTEMVRLTQAGPEKLVIATVTGGSQSGVSNSFNVIPGALHHYALSTITSAQTVGVPFDITITAQDSTGNTVMLPDTASLTTTAGTITPLASPPLVDGQTTFSVRVTLADTGRSITATKLGGTCSGRSNAFDVVGGSLHHFAFGPIGNPRTSGVAFDITIVAQDEYNNTAEGFVETVALSTSAGPIIPVVSGTFVEGIRHETVRITGAGNNQTIEATRTGGTEAGMSNGFDLVQTALASVLVNPCFETGKTPWVFYTNGLATFTSDAPGCGTQRKAHVSVATQGTNVQLYQSNIPLQPAQLYRLRFRAYSSTGHDLSVSLGKHTTPYTSYGLSDVVFNLTTVWQEFSIEFTTKGFTSPVTDGRLRFWFAPFDASGDHFYVDTVMLATVTTSLPPTITGQPSDQSIVVGLPASFSVTATGSLPLIYQWKRNSLNIPGATASTYAIPAVTAGDSGAVFACVVSNLSGSTTSTGALLRVISAPSNVIVNGGFEEGTAPWTFYTSGSGNIARVSPGAAGSPYAARISIVTPGTNVQLYQSGFPLEARTTYRLTFSAYSSSGHDMAVYLHQQTSPYANYGVNYWVVNLSTGWSDYSKTFTTAGFNGTVSDARLRFWFAPYDAAGDKFLIDNVVLEKSPVAREAVAAEIPLQFALRQNYPNPFNPVTVISYDLPAASLVSLKIYDLLGKEITTLVNEMQDEGFKSVEFDASNLASGVYLYRLQSGTFVDTKKLVVVK